MNIPDEQLERNYRLRLREIVADSILLEVITALRELRIADMWLAGGAVRNIVWKRLYGSDCTLVVKDFDVAFFDKDSNRERESQIKQYLVQKLPELIFDVKNQASFGVWRQGRFVFQSTTDGISNWLLTTAAVGIALNDNGEIDILAPYGLFDLFEGVVRPTPNQCGGDAAERKKNDLLAGCSRLRGAAWGELVLQSDTVVS